MNDEARNLTSLATLLQVATVFNIPCNEILSDTRKPAVARARMVVMYLLYECHGFTHQQAANALDRIDHSTSIHARRTITYLMAQDDTFAATMRSLRATNAAPSHPSCD